MSDCKAYRQEIGEAADGGGLSPDARAHLALCRACAGELRERESLRALVGGLGKVGAPADFEFRLRARMAAAKAGEGRDRFSGGRWFYGFAPFAVAACFVVVSATLYFKQATRPRTPSAPAVAASHARDTGNDPFNSINNEQSRSAVPAVTGGEVLKVTQQNGVASHRTQKPARRVTAQPRELALKGERRSDAAAQNTLISSVTSAPVLTLKTSSEPLRVILRDERGAERVVPMRSVSFGSQDFLSRGTTPRPSPVEVGGVW